MTDNANGGQEIDLQLALSWVNAWNESDSEKSLISNKLLCSVSYDVDNVLEFLKPFTGCKAETCIGLNTEEKEYQYLIVLVVKNETGNPVAAFDVGLRCPPFCP